jgi:hypothetical protein
MHEEMEHLTTQFADQGISFPNEDEGGIKRVPMYKHSMQRLKVNWIGLKLSPPLLLGMLEGRREEEEQGAVGRHRQKGRIL